jgi:hypothetical protein
MRLAAAAFAILALAALLSVASAQESGCRIVRASKAGFLEDCGKQLNSFTISLSEASLGASGVEREAFSDLHGYFSFPCPVAPMCGREASIGGFFVDAENWSKSTKDEQAIYRIARSVPMMALSWSFAGGEPAPMPPVACPVFDVSVGDMTGRAVCFDQAAVKGGNMIVAVVADDKVGMVLSFHRPNGSSAQLRDEVLGLMPRFKIERATGDVGLMRWFR